MLKRLPAILAAALVTYAADSLATHATASEQATATIAAHAQFASRTSLTVSTNTLQFDVTDPGTPPIVSVNFVAGARTRSDGEVMLIIEPLRALEGPGGAADVDAAVEFAGDGEGTLAGVIRTAPVLAGRWVGSGRHTGRLCFLLRAGEAGAYWLPVRFVLTAP